MKNNFNKNKKMLNFIEKLVKKQRKVRIMTFGNLNSTQAQYLTNMERKSEREDESIENEINTYKAMREKALELPGFYPLVPDNELNECLTADQVRANRQEYLGRFKYQYYIGKYYG